MPHTKDEMNQLRKQYKNNFGLALHFHADRELQFEFRMLWAMGQHIITEFKDTLHTHKKARSEATFPALGKNTGPVFTVSVFL